MRAAVLTFVCASVAHAQAHENLNAVLWMQTAAEYQAAARQAFHAAGANLQRALKDPNWTAALEQHGPATEYAKRPPAVILDLDETVLDNSPFQAALTARRASFSDSEWERWVAGKRAGLVPGAREFLASAHARGVSIFYVSNRICDPSNAGDATVAVLRTHALPFHPTRLLCRTESGDKSARRSAVAAGHRILLLIGDDLNDFVSLPLDAGLRAAFVSDFAQYWGERWFLIPNPAYGSWERSIGTTVEAKTKALRQ